MDTIISLFKEVRQIPSPAAKVAFLKERRTPAIDQIIADAMDPSITYGVTSKDVGAVECNVRVEIPWNYLDFHKLLGKFAKREITGNAAIDALRHMLARIPDEETRELLKKILDRDLKLGMSWKVYREEVLGLTDTFEVALAQHLEKVTGVNPVDGTHYASRKCDGLRLIAIVNPETGTVEFRSRQNKVFKTLDNLKPAALRFCAGLATKTVLDGELCKVNEAGDEDFQAIMKEARRKDYNIEDCCYQVFDIITYDEFCAGYSKNILSQRFETLARCNRKYEELPHERCWIRPLKQERLTCQDDFDRWAGYVEKGNWEGFMLRKDTAYHSGRTKDLLKVKKFHDAEYVIEGVDLGKMTTSLPGQGVVEYEGVTRLLITHKGSRVGVGAGLSREQRIAWMKDPKLIVGKTVTIKYFEETRNKNGSYSLRFPTLKYVYENGRDC